jgi:hypothetical protein
MVEIEHTLGFSPKRRSLISWGLKLVVEELRGLNFSHLYLGGSFVSLKLSPNDIDGYILARLDSKSLKIVLERKEVWWVQYHMDIYPAFEDLEGEGSVDYWKSWFGHTDDDPPKPKGIIKLSLGR